MNVPQCCGRRAYDFFAEQVDVLETTDGLLNAAIAISMHAFDDVRPYQVVGKLRGLTDRVAGRVRSRQPQALLAHLHDVLFEEAGFRGNMTAYDSPLNSFLPAVLESRLRIPVSLSLIYKAVAEPLGVRVDGINAPGHFLVRIQIDGERMIVDPFVRGRILSPSDLMLRSDHCWRHREFELEHLLQGTSNREWISRMLGNLQHTFHRMRHCDDLAAMTELQELLG